MSRKTVVEEAVIQMKNLEDALKENAKGILASTMRQEIKSLVKESLKEQDEVDTDDEEEVDIVSPEEEEDVNVDDEETFDVEDDEMDDEDDDMDVEDDDMDDEDDDIDDEDEDMGVNMGLDVDDEEETIDMRGASDEDVAVVFSKMGKNDKVSIEKIGDYYDLKDTENDTEYIIKLNESDEDEFGSMRGRYFSDEEEEDEFGPMMGSRFDDEEDDRFSSMKGGRFDDEDRFGSMMSSKFNDEEDEDEDGFGSMKGGRFDDEDRFGSMMSSRFDDEEENEDGFGSMKGGRFGREPEETIYELEIGEEMEGDVGLGEELDEMYMDEDMSYEDLGETYMDEDMTYEDLDEMFVEEDSWSSMSDDTNKFKVHESKQKTGSASKFKYSKKPNQEGGFNTKMKEGSKRYGKSGKANFDYDNEDPNSEIVMKIVNKITKGKKIETKEASRTLANNRKVKRNLMASPSQLKEEVEVLREKNDEYRKALDLFRTKLNEVAVFNSNLAYATRLFTEHSTTKPEKINILRRFDNVESLKESKNLYQILKSELSNNNLSDNNINESFNRTVTKSPSTGSSVNLIESKTYENPQFLRMKDLMGKIK
jgi:hypothetical protein